MARTEALAVIQAALPSLDDQHVDVMLAMVKSWSGSSVFDVLPEGEKAKIDRALDRLDRGESVPSDTVFANLAAKLKAAPGQSVFLTSRGPEPV